MVLRDFNLLVTTARRNEEDACSEIWYLLGEMGDPNSTVERTGIAGLIAVKTALKPCEVTKKLRAILKERPYEFRYTLRVIPVEKIIRTDLVEIQRAVIELSSKIDKNESFRVTVEKRFTTVSTNDIIETAAAKIKRRVDLQKPNKVVLIEVVGGVTGVSVIKPTEILSVAKERRILSSPSNQQSHVLNNQI